MAAAIPNVDLVHSHTWYANLAGHLSGLLYNIPHVVSAHSLEPHRPWKAEQLGRRLSAVVLGGADGVRRAPTR
jgi:starch synthase